MKILKYISLIFCIVISVATKAQFAPKDNNAKAMYYLQANELDSAKKYIDLAVQDSSLMKLDKTWYYRGYIYKELYKKYQKDDKFSSYREKAVESLTKAIEINQDAAIHDNALKTLNYLASTFYNDAAFSIRDQEPEVATKDYNRFKEITNVVAPNTDLTQRDIQFNLALATIYNNQDPTDSIYDYEKANKALELYLNVLKLDSNNASANYNVGILYYNKAVSIINHMDYDEDLTIVNKKMDSCVELFLKALPYMKKAYELNWRLDQTLKGLAGIYYGLNDLEKYNYYKEKLEQLHPENAPKD